MESVFPNCLKVSSAVSVFENVGERFLAKSYCPVLFCYWENLENLVSNGPGEIMSLFLISNVVSNLFF